MSIANKLYEQKKAIELEGYKVAYICLYGSQNYGLDINSEEYQSDVDMKAIIVPTLDELISNSKPVSKIIKTKWGECDIKDIRNYFETLLKANPAYIETLYTKHLIIDEDFVSEFEEIFSLKDKLVETLQAQFIRAMYGMMCEKEKALCHPYPTIAHKIEKFGYDGKQAHHIQRLWIMMKDYFEHKKPLQDCFYPSKSEIQYLMDLKLNKLPLEEVKCFVGMIMEHAKSFKDEVLNSIDEGKIDYSIKNDFIHLSRMIIRNKIINEIRDSM